MSATDQPSEAELRAAYEAEIKQIGVEQILLEQVVTLINLGMRRTGLQPGTEDERDPDQVRLAIEAVRALLPLVEQTAAAGGAERLAPIREALSQMQLAYVRLGGEPGAGEPPVPAATGEASQAPGPEAAPPRPTGPPPGAPPAGGPDAGGEPGGPAQRSGRLWVPGQR